MLKYRVHKISFGQVGVNNKILYGIIAVAFVGGMFTVAYAGPIMPKITLAGNVDVTGDLDVNGPITSPTITDLENQISHTSLPSQVIVSIQESGVPGCEERVAVGGEVIWNNDSQVFHFLSSGTPSDGPSGEFDSGLIASGNSFDHTFNQEGAFPYFDLSKEHEQVDNLHIMLLHISQFYLHPLQTTKCPHQLVLLKQTH